MNVNVGVFDPCTESMGPGKRACLWVRGCSINCKGCGTPELISSLPLQPSRVQDILTQVRLAKEEHGIEGISFSGGEPFEQALALAHIAKEARALGLSTLSWSGYTRRHIESLRAPNGARNLLDQLDVLIDGPFATRLVKLGLPLRGSSNQVIHRLTDRYSEVDLKTAKVSITFDKTGTQIVGIMPYELGEAILLLAKSL
ncbi:MAG: 4Fe-4S single cluster domain-containing protein [Candidatus Uhrbacteria bacterium]|nr:4Fe-4S single cluster domain-containing protein [Candidatus Uhrbacteria bacterium]